MLDLMKEKTFLDFQSRKWGICVCTITGNKKSRELGQKFANRKNTLFSMTKDNLLAQHTSNPRTLKKCVKLNENVMASIDELLNSK